MPGLSVERALDLAGHCAGKAASLLWELDENRLRPGVDYQLDLQRQASQTDLPLRLGARPLFKRLSDKVWDRPSFSALLELLEKHGPSTNVGESSCRDTSYEVDRFLDAVVHTSCVRFVHEFLNRWIFMFDFSVDEFRGLLKEMWFTRSKPEMKHVTGFEHAFCGQVQPTGARVGRVLGLNNFLRVFLEESHCRLNYIGVVNSHEAQPCFDLPPSSQKMLTLRFSVCRSVKTAATMFFGTSPEFELSLYTLVELAGRGLLDVQLGPYKARIHVDSGSHGRAIRSAFPELLEVHRGKLNGKCHPLEPCSVAPALCGSSHQPGNATEAVLKDQDCSDQSFSSDASLEDEEGNIYKPVDWAYASVKKARISSVRSIDWNNALSPPFAKGEDFVIESDDSVSSLVKVKPHLCVLCETPASSFGDDLCLKTHRSADSAGVKANCSARRQSFCIVDEVAADLVCEEGPLALTDTAPSGTVDRVRATAPPFSENQDVSIGSSMRAGDRVHTKPRAQDMCSALARARVHVWSSPEQSIERKEKGEELLFTPCPTSDRSRENGSQSPVGSWSPEDNSWSSGAISGKSVARPKARSTRRIARKLMRDLCEARRSGCCPSMISKHRRVGRSNC